MARTSYLYLNRRKANRRIHQVNNIWTPDSNTIALYSLGDGIARYEHGYGIAPGDCGLNDLSGNGYTLSTVNGPTRLIDGYEFVNASNQYLEHTGNYSAHGGITALTIEVLIKFDSLPGAGDTWFLTSFYGDIQNRARLEIVNTAGTYTIKGSVEANDVSGGPFAVLNAGQALALTAQYNKIVLTWLKSGVVDTLRLWLNGGQVGSTGINVNETFTLPDAGTSKITVGHAFTHTAGQGTDGVIARARFSKVERYAAAYTPLPRLATGRDVR